MTNRFPAARHVASMALLAATVAMVAACSESAPPSAPASAPNSTSTPAAAPVQAPAEATTPANAPAAASNVAPAAQPGSEAGGTESNMLTVMGVRLPLPPGFRQVPPANQMRLAEVQVADASGDPSKVSTIAFSTAGGTVEANLDRWTRQVLDDSGQPSKATITERETSGLKWSHIETTGSFVGMGEGPAKPAWMLRGAVVKLPKGLLFVKMTGPAEAMKSHGAAFDAMMGGMTLPQ